MKTVLITGANRGLGLELTKIFLINNWRVIAACRDVGNMPKDLPNTENLRTVTLDVSKEESLKKLPTVTGDIALDVLINNAGIYDNASDGAPVYDKIPDIMNVFLMDGVAPRVIGESLASQLEKGQEKLIVSISSHMGVVSLADEYVAKHWPYSASKAALNFSMATFSKVHPNIKSVLIHPGLMRTRLGDKEFPLGPDESAEGIYNLITSQSKLIDGKLTDHLGNSLESNI